MSQDTYLAREANRQSYESLAMLAMLAAIACVMVGILFAADWYERGRARPTVASTKAVVRATTGIANPPAGASQPRIVGTPITMNPSPSKQTK